MLKLSLIIKCYIVITFVSLFWSDVRLLDIKEFKATISTELFQKFLIICLWYISTDIYLDDTNNFPLQSLINTHATFCRATCCYILKESEKINVVIFSTRSNLRETRLESWYEHACRYMGFVLALFPLQRLKSRVLVGYEWHKI